MSPFEVVSRIVVPARAYENQFFVVYVNRCDIEQELTYCGLSCAVGPDGTDLARAGGGEQLLVVDLDPAALTAGQAPATPIYAIAGPICIPLSISDRQEPHHDGADQPRERPRAAAHTAADHGRPDFPFAYDDYVQHPSGIGTVPVEAHGERVAIIGGGVSGTLVARELLRMGLRPVLYEADQIGGRMRSVPFDGHPGITAELGSMRFPPSSTTLFHYLDEMGLSTEPFPNPLSDATPSTVVDLKGERHFARTIDDLPGIYREVSQGWANTLAEHADGLALDEAIRNRDVHRIQALWGDLVRRYDDVTFYGFLCQSKDFVSFAKRELFGQVGFGTGGWDTDFPNSILEILRVVSTGADDAHRGIVGGSQQLPVKLWNTPVPGAVHWPAGTSVQSLHDGGVPRPRVVELRRTHPTPSP